MKFIFDFSVSLIGNERILFFLLFFFVKFKGAFAVFGDGYFEIK